MNKSKFEIPEYFMLQLPNHQVLSYYKWKDLALAKRDAKKVADGLHEIVKIITIDSTLKQEIVETIRPKTDLAEIDDYERHSKNVWKKLDHKFD